VPQALAAHEKKVIMGVMAMSKRQSVEITPDAKEALDNIATWTKHTQRVVVEQLLLWVSRQPLEIQSMITASVPEAMRPKYDAWVMAQMRRAINPAEDADEVDRPLDVDLDPGELELRDGRRVGKPRNRKDKSA
jgi:predicted transcriptional regulator